MLAASFNISKIANNGLDITLASNLHSLTALGRKAGFQTHVIFKT
jgi:hypothetical protein